MKQEEVVKVVVEAILNHEIVMLNCVTEQKKKLKEVGLGPIVLNRLKTDEDFHKWIKKYSVDKQLLIMETVQNSTEQYKYLMNKRIELCNKLFDLTGLKLLDELGQVIPDSNKKFDDLVNQLKIIDK